MKSESGILRLVGHHAAWSCVGIALGLFLLAAFLVARLAWAPMSIASYIGNFEQEIASRLPAGKSLQIKDVQLSLSGEAGLAVRLSDVELLQGDRVLLATPQIDFEIGLGNLLRSKFHPKRIFIPSMTASVVREKNGRFVIAGFDPGDAHEIMGPPVRSQAVFYDPNEPEFVSLIYAMRRAIIPLADEDLTKRPPRVLIRNTRIDFSDEVAGKTRIWENVAFSYNPVGEKDQLWRIDFAADGKSGRIGFAMAEYPLEQEDESNGGRSIEFRFADVSVADFLPKLADPENNVKFNSPFYGAARLDFDRKGVLVDMKMALDIGAGRIDFGPKDNALLDEASFRFDWNPEVRALALAHGQVLFGETGGIFKGLAVWPKMREGDIRLAIEGQNIKLAARDNPHPSRLLKQMLLQARLGRDTGILTVDRFSMIAEEGSVDAAGSMALVEGDLTMGLAATVSPMPHDLLAHMWPVNIANGARKWLIQNVEAGRTTGGTIEVALTGEMLERNDEGRVVLPDDSIDVSFGVENLRIKGFGDLPPAIGVSGSGIVTGRTFLAAIKEGHFVTKQGREFPIRSGKVEIPDHSQKPATGIVVLEGKGSASALGEIINSDPMNVLRQEKLVAKGLSGSADAKVRLSFPFVKKPRKEDVVYSAKVDLHNFSSDEPVRGRKVEGANLVITTDGRRVDINGKGKIDGLDASVSMVTSTDKSIALKGNVKLELTEKDRRALGIHLDDWVKGPVSVELLQQGNKPGHYLVKADLTQATLSIDEIGWTKKAGVAGDLSFETIQDDTRFDISRIKLSGDGFQGQGSAIVDLKTGLEKLVVRQLRLSRGDSFSLIADKSASGLYKIDLKGDLLDLRGVFKSRSFASGANKKDAGTRDISYDLVAKIKRLVGLGGHVVNNFEGLHQVRKGKDVLIKAEGQIDGRAPISISTEKAKQPKFFIVSQDAGAFLRFTGALNFVKGGYLSMNVALQDGWQKVSGGVYMKDFSLRGAVQKETSNRSTTEQVNTQFSRFQVAYTGRNGVYSLGQGILQGPALGATVAGHVNMVDKSLAISGTYIPVYAVNNLFSKLPVLGRALGNRKHEGLLGITYKVKGTIAKPRVFANPASILAPGALRKIFEYN